MKLGRAVSRKDDSVLPLLRLDGIGGHPRRSWLFWLPAVCAIVVGPASAQAEQTLEDLLVEKGVISEEERDALEEEEASASEGDASEGDVVIKADYKGIRIERSDGSFVFGFGGRLQVDGAAFIEDESDMGNGAEIRRARIKSYGTLFHDWEYKLEVNFDPDLEVPMTDAWIRYNGFDHFDLTLGHQKVPFSQQSLTSSNWQVFQERALPDAFIDNDESGRRRLGLVLNTAGDWWSYRGGFFGGGTDDAGAEDEDWGLGHRGVIAPWAEEGKVLAFGAAVVYRDFESDSELRYRARPEANIAGTRLVDTDVMTAARDNTMINFSLAGVCGRFHWQGEYTRSFVDRGDGQGDLEFDGWYAQAGVFLTGESRVFDLKSGEFKRVIPKDSTLGAWELAARYSGIDLADRDLRGGRQQDMTLALNWWVNAALMFRLNYIYGHADHNSSVTLDGRSEDVHAFTGRAQIVF